jgi:hypothetical protein
MRHIMGNQVPALAQAQACNILSIHLVTYLYDSVYSVRMEPNIFRFAVVYNFIHVLLLEFQVRFWIRLPGLS